MANEIKKEVLLKTTTTWDNKPYEKINTNQTEATVLKLTFQPHSKLPMHKHVMLNIAYVNKGILTVITESGKEKTFKQGEIIAEVVNEFHYGRNDGDSEVELIVVYVGEKDSEISISE